MSCPLDDLHHHSVMETNVYRPKGANSAIYVNKRFMLLHCISDFALASLLCNLVLSPSFMSF